MRINIDWLKAFVKVDLSLPELIEKLNNIGMLVDSYEKQDGDAILELETYANRPDTLGHLGVARELATAMGVSLEKQTWPLTELEENILDCFDLQIWDEELCPRYCGMIVKGVKVGPSPEWLVKRIEAMDLNPVNNVVDVTNYVLFSTAQPIHAFDLDKLQGYKIIVRRAHKGELLRSLDGHNITLSSEMLVIADEKIPVALAGIIGGEESAVTAETQDVFIESAYFDPGSIRKTWKAVGVQTDASYRFERGADISYPPNAALMAASLLTQMGGKAVKGVLDVYPKPRKPKTVILRHHRIAELLGIEVDEKFVNRILSDLEFHVETQQPGIWRIQVPSFRVDIEREADLIEEIARFYGYDNIPAQLPAWKAVDPGIDQKKVLEDGLRHVLFHQGFDEVVNYSFFDPAKEGAFKSGLQAIEIRNPISTKAGLLRTTLVGGLLDNIAWNKNRGIEGVYIFEIGNIYFWKEERCAEKHSLAMVTSGLLGDPQWQSMREKTDFFHLKGTCESFLSFLRYSRISFQEKDHPYCEPGQSLTLSIKGKLIGWLGQLQSEILGVYDLEESVWAAEIDLEALFAMQPQAYMYLPVNKFPSVIRDISFLVDRNVAYQDIKQTVEKLSISNLESFYLYDRYSGSSVPKDKVSLSIRFVFQHSQRTLLAEEVENLLEKIKAALKAGFNLQLREGGKIDK